MTIKTVRQFEIRSILKNFQELKLEWINVPFNLDRVVALTGDNTIDLDFVLAEQFKTSQKNSESQNFEKVIFVAYSNFDVSCFLISEENFCCRIYNQNYISHNTSQPQFVLDLTKIFQDPILFQKLRRFSKYFKLPFVTKPEKLNDYLHRIYQKKFYKNRDQKIIHFWLVSLLANIKNNSLLFIGRPETELHPESLLRFQDFIWKLGKEFDSRIIVLTYSSLFLQRVPGRMVYTWRMGRFVSSDGFEEDNFLALENKILGSKLLNTDYSYCNWFISLSKNKKNRQKLKNFDFKKLCPNSSFGLLCILNSIKNKR